MFIPIFFPINHYSNDNDDYESLHALDCECSKCKERAKIKYRSKRYYESRYAVPKSFMLKRVLWRVLAWLVGLTGLFVALSGVFLGDYYEEIIGEGHMFIQIFAPLLIGAGIIVIGILTLDKKLSATYIWKCDEKIDLKKYNYEDSDKTWKEIIEKANVPKNYWLSKPKEDWEYEQ